MNEDKVETANSFMRIWWTIEWDFIIIIIIIIVTIIIIIIIVTIIIIIYNVASANGFNQWYLTLKVINSFNIQFDHLVFCFNPESNLSERKRKEEKKKLSFLIHFW